MVSSESKMNSNCVNRVNNRFLLSNVKVIMVSMIWSGNGAGARETTPDMTFWIDRKMDYRLVKSKWLW